MSETKNTHALLREIIQETQCKPGWNFWIAGEDGDCTLMITIDGVNNYDHSEKFRVTHVHPVPITTFNGNSWRRWILEQCLRTENHEMGENLRFGPEQRRPFAPMHGPGEDPYTVHEIRSEQDALTTQDGTIRQGPV